MESTSGMFGLLLVALLGMLEPEAAKLEVDVRPSQPQSVGKADLVLRDPIEGTEKLRHPIEVPWKGELALDRPVAGLLLEIESPTLWSAPFRVPETGQPEALEIDTFQRGELTFSEEPSAASTPAAMPAAIQVEVASVPAPRGKDLLKKTRLACILEKDRWRCPAPALALDLRLEKPGHVPRYFFGAKIEPGKSLDLGRLRFEQGASISGFVAVEEGEPKGATIGLGPAGTWGPRDGQRQNLRRAEAIANERGFFQVQGVAPGGYRLEASRKGLSATELWPVEVLEGKETSLAEPILLTRAAELEVHVAPPLGPLGRPWKLLLVRETPGSDGGGEVLTEEADAAGTSVWKELQPGSYLLMVCNPDGEKTGAGDDSIWASQFVELLPGSQAIYQDIAVVRVEGTLTAGEDPVLGRLIFGGFNGSPHATVWSDEDGRFEGQLPRKGSWQLDVEIGGQLLSLEPVEVEPRGGKPARLDLHLPDTRFHGKVIHREKGVAGAQLWGHSTGSGKSFRFDTTADDEGGFDLRGLAAGSYQVTVSSARLRLASPRLRFDIREGIEDPAAEIELEEYQRLEGQILANGVGVPLAAFGVFFRSRHGEDLQRGQGDAAGVLRVAVPESAQEIAMVITPAGFAWQILPLRPSAGTAGSSPFFVEAAQNGGTLRIKSPDPAAARLFASGAEVPLQMVASTLQRGGNAEVAAGGWTFKNTAPGFYRVCGAAKCAEGILATGGILELVLSEI